MRKSKLAVKNEMGKLFAGWIGAPVLVPEFVLEAITRLMFCIRLIAKISGRRTNRLDKSTTEDVA